MRVKQTLTQPHKISARITIYIAGKFTTFSEKEKKKLKMFSSFFVVAIWLMCLMLHNIYTRSLLETKSSQTEN